MDPIVVLAAVLAAVASLGTILWVAVTSKRSLADAYVAGRRAALKDARHLVRERAALATELAPTGQLLYGLVRAQMADQIESDLQELA